MYQKPNQNWSQIPTTETYRSRSPLNNEAQQSRKIKYRNALEKQMEEHRSNCRSQLATKLKERQRIIAQIQKERASFIENKLGKVKTEQLYQLQNMDLMKFNNKMTSKLGSNQKYENNQFFKLEDGQKNRKIQTKRNFQMQNYLNGRQSQMRQEYRSQQKQLNIYQKQMYNSYVQNQYKRHESNRQLWKNKYLVDKNSPNKIVNQGYAYRAFLKQQIEQKRNKNKNQNQFQQKNERYTSSPAFLGLGESHDRIRQMSLIDKHLGGGNDLKRQEQTKTAMSRAEFLHQNLTQRKRSTDLYRQRIPPLPLPKTQELPAQRKQFLRYDFITGTSKTFFA